MDHPLHIHGFRYQPYAYFRDDEAAGCATVTCCSTARAA
jgi:hypothetical protein